MGSRDGKYFKYLDPEPELKESSHQIKPIK